MNGVRFYFKTTSKIVLILIFDGKVEETWSSITKETTFRKYYQNIPYPNPIRLETSL